MGNTTDTRNRTIDIAKGIGIMLVVFGHNWMVSHGNREVFRVVFSFHMPLFLFLSGIFLRASGSSKEFLASRMHSLLKPYWVTLLILGLVKLSSDAMHHRDFAASFVNYMEGVLYGTGRTIAWPPLWYLPHLFIASCVAMVVIKLPVSPAMKGLVVTASLIVGVAVVLRPTDLPWSLDVLPVSLFYLVSGYLCRGFVKSMVFNGPHLLLALSVFFLCHYYFNDTIDLNFRIYDSLLVSTLQALLGIYICLGLASFLARFAMAAKALAYVGSGTLFILLFHSYIQDKVFGLLAGPLGESVVAGLLSGFAAVVVPLLLWELSKRSVYFSALLLPKMPVPRVS